MDVFQERVTIVAKIASNHAVYKHNEGSTYFTHGITLFLYILVIV